LIIEKIEWTNVETKNHKLEATIKKFHEPSLDLNMFPMVKRRDLKIINQDMQAVNNGDIRFAYNIIRYMGWWWKCFG
jgi:hypothetical protein